MCQIIVKQAGKKFDMEKLKKAEKHNEDGYSITWWENERVNVFKTFDFSKALTLATTMKEHTAIFHMRYATKGDKSYDNLHPFKVPNGYVMHNGTMFGLGSGTKSDTAEFAEILNGCDYNSISDIEPLIRPFIDDSINRLVFFEDDGKVVIMNKDLGVVEDGLWYSNTYHKKDTGWCRPGSCKPKTNTTPYKNDLWCYAKGKDLKELGARLPESTYYVKKSDLRQKETMQLVKPRIKTHKVFVYGTLKRGHGNNKHFLKDAVFLGKATTSNRWTMGGKGQSFPYVYEENEKLGANIVGEVFAIDSVELQGLDRLEGVPSHYKRNTIEVDYSDDGTTEEVIMYSKTYFKTDYHKDQEMITEWSA